MNTTTRSLMIFAMFAVGASAHEPNKCQTSLSIADVSTAMGAGVAVQPVFSNGGLKGWRIYNTGKSRQLTAQGINSGTLMTHVCGIPANEIFAKGGDACCEVDASREFEVTLLISDIETKILIKRGT